MGLGLQCKPGEWLSKFCTGFTLEDPTECSACNVSCPLGEPALPFLRERSAVALHGSLATGLNNSAPAATSLRGGGSRVLA